MILLDRYIAANFLKGMLPVMVLLLALFSFLALAEELENVGQGTFRQVDAFLVVLYTSPRRIVDLMPVTALLGGLMGLGAMANHQELIAARAAGLSKARMARPVFQATLLLAVMVVLMQSILVPASERSASSLRLKAIESTSMGSSSRLDFWTRSGQNFVHVGDVLFNQVLEDVEIYQTGDRGKLKTFIQADQATIVGADTWMLEGVTRTELSGMSAQEQQLEQIEWQNLLTREQTDILILPLEALAPHELVLYIRHLRDNGLDTHHYRVVFWKQISIAISVIAMGLLSLPLLVGSTRGMSASQRVLLGGILGIVFYLMQQVTGNLAGLLNLVPSVTILTPVLVLLMISVLAQYWPGLRKSRSASKLRTQA
ncbi:MAG: LPS export ABC transporter permease LptG [Xanthomonadales bacterium]|jgi:lipopolysaccharide export system permease protein|nr:LPS export ABC transporter permease LptG [Xanthomonadales bacterium]MDH3924354.1 LPS export ABC transporter permease LptG [Xanthomonadales bacterium]MDH3940923.1 LPS export ABC transporter permease LptG [Xanthomonadales bacterium]MDH4002440.1 LPS export ABC transporter permease LptG [Xanthomonadales bacterium]